MKFKVTRIWIVEANYMSEALDKSRNFEHNEVDVRRLK